MNIRLSSSSSLSSECLKIGGSKSISNRLLILQALYPNLKIENLSDADDTRVLAEALRKTAGVVDVGHAGTAMRFLTAYYAAQNGAEVLLTGSERMQQRPIGILVNALRMLGAEISYLEKEGFPPLQIKGKTLKNTEVALSAEVSSQFISALLLIAPKLPHGLFLKLEGEITSLPYIKMTLALLAQLEIETVFKGNTLKVLSKKEVVPTTITVESDWSSLSYFYSLVALSSSGQCCFRYFTSSDLQGDTALARIYEQFGVKTHFEKKGMVRLEKEDVLLSKKIHLNLLDTPDLAQTVAVTCLGLGVSCHLTGLHTLKIKETDRLAALKAELEKCGGKVQVSEDNLTLEADGQVKDQVKISTYQDHRMAMAFAPLAIKTSLVIEDAEVVSKSFPNFWNLLNQVGISVSKE